MTSTVTPERWAFDLTILLNTALGADRFPVDVASLAKDYSRQRFPDDPIVAVRGDDLPKFDGALYPVPSKGGWAIIYNNSIKSLGRINFTLAHEFGHYLLHRQIYPDGIECGQQKIVRWDSEIGQVEHQANVFAANLLMPLDDFRQQIPERAKVDFEMLEACKDRYQVSFIATVLRWLSYTAKRAVLVVSVDGYILWARSSKSALRTGAFFKIADRPPIAIPASSLPLNPQALVNGRGDVRHDRGVWLPEPVREVALSPEQYDFSLSLLLLEDAAGPAFEEESDEDTYDRFTRHPGRREW